MPVSENARRPSSRSTTISAPSRLLRERHRGERDLFDDVAVRACASRSAASGSRPTRANDLPDLVLEQDDDRERDVEEQIAEHRVNGGEVEQARARQEVQPQHRDDADDHVNGARAADQQEDLVDDRREDEDVEHGEPFRSWTWKTVGESVQHAATSSGSRRSSASSAWSPRRRALESRAHPATPHEPRPPSSLQALAHRKVEARPR